MAHGPVPGAGSTSSRPLPKPKVHLGRVIYIAAVAAIGGFLFGFDSSVINGANAGLWYQLQVTNEWLQGFLTSVALLGSALGALIAGGLTARFGRKRIMALASLLFLFAGFGQALPFATLDFLFWRFLGGFAIGLVAVACPMYISESAPAYLRGRLTALFQLALVFGIFLTNFTNQLILSQVPDEPPPSGEGMGLIAPAATNNDWLLGLQAWQWMFLLLLIPAILFFFLSLTLPESARYLVSKHREDEARVVLKQIYNEDVEARLMAIDESLKGEIKPKFSDIKGAAFGLKPIVWIGIWIAIFQQLTGINMIIYFGNVIWGSVGFSEQQSFLTSTINTGVNLVFTILAVVLIDRLGRRALLLIGSVGMAICLGGVTVMFTISPTQDGAPVLSEGAGVLTVLFVLGFTASFAVSWGAVMWVLLGEMFPNSYRAAAMSVAVMANWLANFAVTELSIPLVGFSISLTYALLTAFCVISFFYVLKYVKETKGVSLEDMEELEKAEV